MIEIREWIDGADVLLVSIGRRLHELSGLVADNPIPAVAFATVALAFTLLRPR
jgi:hypothetical protein